VPLNRGGARPRVIVADDHPRVLIALTAILSESCDVLASLADGASAIDAASRLRPDIVVLDIEMPGMDGFEACTRIRSTGSDVPIVFVSSHFRDDFVLEGLARGASGFVAKPRVAVDLSDAVGHVHAGRAFVPRAGLLPRWRRRDRRHDVQIYATDAVLVDGAAAFLDAALACGDSIIAVATDSHRRAIDRQLSARGHDLARLVTADRYLPLDAEAAADTVVKNGRVDRGQLVAAIQPVVERALQASAGSPPHVCLFGEIAAVLHARRLFEAMLEVEQVGDDLIASQPITVLCSCAIDLRRDDGTDLVASVCGAHSAIVPSPVLI
jgi:CheY-like chemotaxis protein